MLKLLIWGVVIASAVAAGAIYYPKWREQQDDGRSACLRNVKNATRACLLYAEQNDERLPLAINWMDALLPHMDRRMHCPKVRDGFGYAYNEAYSGASVAKAQSKSDILIYESTNLEWNAHDRAETIPTPGRHRGRAYIAYTDSDDLRPD